MRDNVPGSVYFGALPSAVSMLPFKLVCARTFYLPIGQNLFPVSKYRLTCEHLLEEGIAGPEDLVEPAPASDEDVLLVHTPEYVRKLRTGTLSESEARQLEAPYSRELVEAYWLCVAAQSSPRIARCATESPSTSAAAFITPSPTTVRAST